MNNTYVARLESRLDMAETELSNLNEMLLKVGFPDGIQTLKETVSEVLHEEGVV